MIRIVSYIAVCCVSLLSAPALAAAPDVPDRSRTIIVGAVSHDAKGRFPKLEVMANYLAAQLQDLGIRHGRVVITRNNAQMVDLLRLGEVDVISETAFSTIYFANEARSEPLLLEWKKGVPKYHSVFITRRESSIESLSDLRGRKIAFEDPGSTSGFLLPMAVLRTHGIEATEVAPTAPPLPEGVSYAFTDDEINVAAWVARGVADAGAISNLDWADITRMPGPLKSALRIFHTTEPVLRSVLSVRGDLDPSVKRRIKDILMAMDANVGGREVLEVYNKVTKYDEIAGDARQSLDNMRRLYPLVEEAIR